MFEFAFGFAVALLGVITGIHFYFNGRIEEKQKKAETEYAKEVAKICKESYKHIVKEFTTSTPSGTLDEFLESMEKFWVEATSAQFEKLDILTKASKPRVYLHDTESAFVCSAILLLPVGILPYFDLANYSVYLLIFAIAPIIVGIIRFWQLLRAIEVRRY